MIVSSIEWARFDSVTNFDETRLPNVMEGGSRALQRGENPPQAESADQDQSRPMGTADIAIRECGQTPAASSWDNDARLMNSNGVTPAPMVPGRDQAGWRRCRLLAFAYCAPAVLKRERSQLGSAYRVRRIPSRSSMTVGRQRACQAACASASAFCSSGVRGGAARMVVLPLTLKSVDWLGVSGVPAAMAAALAAAAAEAALTAFAASAACPWSIENDWADAVAMVAAVMRITPRMVRTFKTPPGTATNYNADSD
jgi:hypothetical protein